MNTELLGWTMLHFLWLGAALLLVAAVVRLALRRAGANVRYAHSLVMLVALAVLPIAIAAWLANSSIPGGWGLRSAEPPGGDIADQAGGFAALRPQPPIEDTGIASGTQVIELNPDYVPPESAQPTLPPPPSAGEGLGEGGIAAESAGGFAALRPQPPMKSDEASGTLELSLAYIQTAVPYLPYLWLLGTPITFALLATGLIGAERMRRHGTLITDGPVYEACERLRASLRITRRVALAVCERVAQPVLVGIVRPLILLPPAALAGWSPEQLEMVLLHELAHVRRWDNLVNLAQRVIESLLFFHPAVWIASTWVRRDREDCCDAVVVTRTAQPKQYAELLIALASPQPLAGAALARHPLAGRLRRILKLEDEPMLVSRNTIGLLTLAVVAIALVVISGPLRVQGENQPVEEPASSDPPPPSAGEGLGEEEISDETVPPNSTNAAIESSPTVSSSEERIASIYQFDKEIKEDLEKLLDAVDFGENTSVKVAGREYLVITAPADEHARIAKVLERFLGDKGWRIQTPLPIRESETTAERSFNPPAASADGGAKPSSQKSTKTYTLPTDKTYLRTFLGDSENRQLFGIVDVQGNKVVVTGSKSQHDKLNEMIPGLVEDRGTLRNRNAKNHEQTSKVDTEPRTPIELEFNWPNSAETNRPDANPLAGIAYPSPREGEIAQKVWGKLRLKIGPATEDDLKASGAEHGFRLHNEFSERLIPGGKQPFILIEINGTPLTSWDIIAEEINALNFDNKRNPDCVVMSGGKKFPIQRPFVSLQSNSTNGSNAQPVLWPNSEGENSANPLAGIAYPSSREGEIAQRAWKLLRLKLAPGTEAELEIARKHDHEGGVKIITHSNERNGVAILTKIESTSIENFDDVAHALNQIKVTKDTLPPVSWEAVAENLGRFGGTSNYVPSTLGPNVVAPKYMDPAQPPYIVPPGTVPGAIPVKIEPPKPSTKPFAVDILPTGPRNVIDGKVYSLTPEQVERLKRWLGTKRGDDLSHTIRAGQDEKTWVIHAPPDVHEELQKVVDGKLEPTPANASVAEESAEPTPPLTGIAYASPREWQIALRGFKMLGIVLGPATDEELQLARKHGVQRGLKLVSGPTGKPKESILLIGLAERDTETFEDLNKALELIEADKPASTELTFLICSNGKKPSTILERDESNSPLYRPYMPNDRIVKAHDIPKELRLSVSKWAETVQSIQGVWDDRGQFIMQAARSKHDDLDQLVQGMEKWNEPEAATERAKNPVVTRDENGQPVLEWRSTGLTLKGETSVKFPEASRNMIGPTGVEVIAVEPGSPAAWQDVRPGDVLTSVDRFRMENVPELASILKSFLRGFGRNKTLELRFYRTQGRIQPLLRAIRLPLRAEPVKESAAEEDERRLEFFRRMRDQEQGTTEDGGVDSDAEATAVAPPGQPTPPVPPTPGPAAPSTPGAIPALTASPAELKVLREQVKVFDEQYKRIDALFQQGAKGGSQDLHDLAAYELALAQGELALAEGHRKEALVKFEEAQKVAEEAVKSAQLAFEHGVVTYDFMLQAIKNLAEIKLKVIQLKAGKSISGRGVNSDAGVIGKMVYESRADRYVAPDPPLTYQPTPTTPSGPTQATKPQPIRNSDEPKPSKQPAPAKLPDWPAVSDHDKAHPQGAAPPATTTLPSAAQPPATFTPAAPPATFTPATPSTNAIRIPNFEIRKPTPSPPLDLPTAAPKPVYRYDGKTFQTWRDTWKHELSTDKRIEAVKALAAFGRAGYAKEAAETILDVAGEYDFTAHLSNEAPEAKLRSAIVYNLAVSPYRLDESIWFPMVMKRFNEKPEQWKGLLRYILSSVQRVDKEYVEQIDGLTENSDPRLRSAALEALEAVDQTKFRKRLPAALTESDAGVIQNALNLLNRQLQIRQARTDLAKKDPWNEFPIVEVLTLLSHPSQDIRSQARDVFIRSPELRRHLPALLTDASRKGDHLQAVRAIGEVAKYLGTPLPELETLFDETDDPQLRVAIVVAQSRFRMQGKSKRNLEQELYDESENDEELREMILEEQGSRRQ